MTGPLRDLDGADLGRRPRPSDEAQLQALGVLLDVGVPIELAHAANELLAGGDYRAAAELVGPTVELVVALAELAHEAGSS